MTGQTIKAGRGSQIQIGRYRDFGRDAGKLHRISGADRRLRENRCRSSCKRPDCERCFAGKSGYGFVYGKMNGCLPPDIRILDVELVKNGFHARKSAVGKVYEYRIDTGIKQDVFTRKYSGHFPGEPDLARMREAAGYLTGTHFLRGIRIKR